MNILLVEPPVSPFDVPTGAVGLPEPLALETVAAGLVPDHEVRILDLRLEPQEKFRQTLESFQPDVVGTGSVTANLHLAKDVLQEAKRFDPRIRTLIGGHHVTFRPQDAKDRFIDAVVLGEGDYSAPELVSAWEHNNPLVDIQGLAVNENGVQYRTPTRALSDLEALPRPARHLVAQYRSQYFQREYRPIVSMSTSRGCPFRCDFCTLWKLNRGTYRRRSAESVVDEMAELPEEFIDFIDDNSLDDFRRARKIGRLIKERGLRKKFRAYARADTIARNPDLIAELSEAGLRLVLVGFEAADQERLNSYSKSSKVEQGRQAIEILQRNQIQIASYFLVDPTFTATDFDKLWAYVEAMGLSDPVFTILVPFPGSPLYGRMEEDLAKADRRLFDFFHTVFKTHLPMEEFYARFADLYHKAYSLERQMRLVPSNVPREMVVGKVRKLEACLERLESLRDHHAAEPVAKLALASAG